MKKVTHVTHVTRNPTDLLRKDLNETRVTCVTCVTLQGNQKNMSLKKDKKLKKKDKKDKKLKKNNFQKNNIIHKTQKCNNLCDFPKSVISVTKPNSKKLSQVSQNETSKDIDFKKLNLKEEKLNETSINF